MSVAFSLARAIGWAYCRNMENIKSLKIQLEDTANWGCPASDADRENEVREAFDDARHDDLLSADESAEYLRALLGGQAKPAE